MGVEEVPLRHELNDDDDGSVLEGAERDSIFPPPSPQYRTLVVPVDPIVAAARAVIAFEPVSPVVEEHLLTSEI